MRQSQTSRAEDWVHYLGSNRIEAPSAVVRGRGLEPRKACATGCPIWPNSWHLKSRAFNGSSVGEPSLTWLGNPRDRKEGNAFFLINFGISVGAKLNAQAYVTVIVGPWPSMDRASAS